MHLTAGEQGWCANAKDEGTMQVRGEGGGGFNNAEGGDCTTGDRGHQTAFTLMREKGIRVQATPELAERLRGVVLVCW